MLFESLDHDHEAEARKRAEARAIIAANQRVAKAIKPYLVVAQNSPNEYAARLEYVSSAVEKMITEAAEKYEVEPANISSYVFASLRYACGDCGCDCSDGKCSCDNCSTCNSKESAASWGNPECQKCGAKTEALSNGQCESCRNPGKAAAAHPEGCECNFPVCVRNREGLKEAEDAADTVNITSEAKTAADVETGDSYTQERVSLPSADSSGLGSQGSPQINKDKVPKNGLSPVDVPSKKNPSEMHDIEQAADYDTQTNQGAVSEPNSTTAPSKRVDADKPMQPERTVAPRTKTFPDKGQADPVTRKPLSKWTVEGGVTERD